MFLPNEFLIETDDLEVAASLADVNLEGVTAHQVIARSFGTETVRYLIHCASEIPIALFAAWLYDLMKNRGTDKTRIQGQRLPNNVLEITLLIQTTIQKNQIDAQEFKNEMDEESS
jgi:hypothetical protein